MSDRARGITITRISLDAEAEQALAYVNAHRALDGKEPFDRVKTPYDWAVGTSPSGTVWLICDEGVGYEVAKGSATVEWYGRFDPKPGEPQTISIFPCVGSTFDLDEVAALPRLDDVDLADFVRSFGARLESNFWGLHRALSA